MGNWADDMRYAEQERRDDEEISRRRRERNCTGCYGAVQCTGCTAYYEKLARAALGASK